MEYMVTYSNRKSIVIYVHKDASVEVRCPKRTSIRIIKDIINKKKNWIEKSKEKMLNRVFNDELEEKDKEVLIEKAKKIIPEKVKYFSNIMGVTPSSIRIGNARSYWGCCSGKNKINFSWRLIKASDDVINYVVVHELAHIKEHNHSMAFWNEVKKVIPDYKKYRDELKNME